MAEQNGHLEKGLLSHIQPIRESSLLSDGAAGFLKSIKPEFLTLHRAPKPQKLRKTAYLDGIRGFAALLVYVLHHELWAHGWLKGDEKLENAWGYKGEYYLLSFYGLRNLFVGGMLRDGGNDHG